MIEDLWYKNTIIYSLDVETFMDANGDGIGDFEGLMRRLDYLDSIGVETIWLAPFYASPNRDNGYDVSDYYAVDPRHGSNGDFVEFMHQANERGIKVILDLVVNHTSNEHLWFQEARRDPGSQHHDWYVWSKKKPPGWNKGMVFPGVQDATWSCDRKAKAWYYHRFYDFQPDLNMDNPAVRTEVRRIMGYWLQLGVAGFRVDAVPFVIESTHAGKKSVQHFEYLAEMREFLQWRCGDAILLGEANVLPAENKKYFGNGGEGIHMMFNFFVNQHLFYALASGDTEPLAKALVATRCESQSAQWAQFLRNHDELDLGRLTKKQRETVFARFGPEKEMQLYDRGVRRRLAPMLGERAQIELAYSLLFSLPGTPVLRYGDEIGMGDDLALKERNAVRTPMPWSNGPQAGFSTCARTIRPVLSRGPFGYKTVNVEAQRREDESLLNWMAAMIRLRKECPEIGWGEWSLVETHAPGVLGLHYSWKGNALVILHNFSSKPREVRLRLKDDRAAILTNLRHNDESRADDNRQHRIAVEAYGYRWYRVGRLDHLLARERL
jgi:maltose alpha-D-glucosyltransferase/alpha-amylase